MKKPWVLNYPLSAQRRLWSDWADGQADLSLRWAHRTFCLFCHAQVQLIIAPYRGFVTNITLHHVLILLPFNIHHSLTYFTVDHGHRAPDGGSVGWGQLIWAYRWYCDYLLGWGWGLGRSCCRWNMSCSMTKPKWPERPAKIQISLGIRPVWSESPLSTKWVAKGPRFLHADSEDSDQTGWMPRLIWVFAARTCHFVGFVMLPLKYGPGHAKTCLMPCEQQSLRSACASAQSDQHLCCSLLR